MKRAYPERYPSWFDSLILVAAFAAAIAVPQFQEAANRWLGPSQGWASLEEVEDYRNEEAAKARTKGGKARLKWALREVAWFGRPVLTVLSLGLALASYRSPRMFGRRSRRGVGVLTTTIAGTFSVFYLLNEYTLRHLQPVFVVDRSEALVQVWWSIADVTSMAILATWIVLALGRRWHAEPHWRDRLGRALGVAWISYWFLSGVLDPLWLQW